MLKSEGNKIVIQQITWFFLPATYEHKKRLHSNSVNTTEHMQHWTQNKIISESFALTHFIKYPTLQCVDVYNYMILVLFFKEQVW